MELASGYSDASANPFGFVNNAVANNLNNLGSNLNANLAYVGGQNQASLNNAYGPAGFGGDTARYAAIGADYGRAVPGEIYAGGGGGSDPFAGGAAPYNDYSIPNFGAGSQVNYKAGSPWAAGGNMSGGGGGTGDPGQSQVDWNAYFNGLTAPARDAVPDPTYGGGGAMSNIGGGKIPGQAPDPWATLGYNPSAPIQNGFGYPGGTPSQMFDPSTYGSMGMGVPAGVQYKAGSPWGAGGIMNASGDPSYFDAGRPGSDYNPFGTINSGQAGNGQDAFLGYPQATTPTTFDQRFVNFPGQPYGPGYFDSTFGSVAGKSAYNPTAGGSYPGPMASDYQAQQQQMIRDLYGTLGIIDNAGEDGSSSWPPSGNTLRPEDYFPGGSAAYSRGGG